MVRESVATSEEETATVESVGAVNVLPVQLLPKKPIVADGEGSTGL
jgi:hypothetical protein